MRVEEHIRDYLADNLDFISKDLKLIQKEYYLPAKIGAKGYIDILAKDNFNNFVIIEIKRSEQAARQTINELLKYQGLIKQLYKAQESEIKLVIVSTVWNELIVPFSEIYNDVFISGYKLEINSQNIPKSINSVSPIEPTSLERKISPSQTVELFYTEAKREKFLNILKSKLQKIGIDDFVLVKLNSNGSNPRIVFPFAVYFAFQRQTMSRNYEILPNLDKEIDEIEFEDEDHKLRYIDELIYIKIDIYKDHDSMESSDPVKFTYIINSGQWDIIKIDKNGIFSNDPRISDEQILNEIKGYDGENDVKYLDFTDSKNSKKLEKIQNNLKKSLQWNKKLQKHVDHILNFSKSKSDTFKIAIEIFYPRSLFDAVWRLYTTADPGYMPIYNIVIIFNSSNQIYHYSGELAWNGKSVNTQKVLEKITNDEPFFTFSQCVNGSFDKELLKLMNLKFVNHQDKILNGKTTHSKQIKLRQNEFVNDYKKYHDFDSYFTANDELMSGITYMYKEYTNY
ncbi:endonuclease NucS domain-containing protein [uncultured Draconibacterium sp.]|uniref:endonuclease NucS domain-containing protein n=1 Tax=uncultured Draconibacterium sp. TaxID=1573823 RepID=UPI0029C0BC3F|nr:endonuclease NucS domain-containing protein [uncultured Draconibacterium sp.]